MSRWAYGSARSLRLIYYFMAEKLLTVFIGKVVELPYERYPPISKATKNSRVIFFKASFLSGYGELEWVKLRGNTHSFNSG